VRQLFAKIDTSGDLSMDLEEFKTMFQKISEDVSHSDAAAWFNSIDFDGNGEVSLPEFITDFNNYNHKTLHELIMDQSNKQRAVDSETQR